jgi:triosephosphate isomerase (TIM)
MRKPLIAGNWKMHNTIAETIELLNGLKRELVDCTEVDVLVCPAYTSLSEASDVLIDTGIFLGAQNIYWQEKGAFTGEISPAMLVDAGCSYVIVGHSERRQYFNETNDTVNKRIRAALKAALTPIVCVGEILSERESGKTLPVIETQLKEGLAGFEKEDVLKMTIAYEPVWAIGTGKTATPLEAQEVHKFIREWIKNNIGEDAALGIRILYGGSVKSDNIKELMQQADIDGGLVGGASLDAASFAGIVKNALV